MLAAGREAEIKRSLGYALDWPELKTSGNSINPEP
jgi:hypothetical protein